MGPVFMAVLLLAGWGIFAYSTYRRWNLMMVGADARPFDRVGERLGKVWTYALAQVRMRRYKLAGIAHLVIFVGFLVLLLRTLILWGRGFDADFDFWVFGTEGALGQIYSFLKDVFALLVILGTLVFVYYRVVARLDRMTLSTEGLIILGIILVMMVSDIFYDGATLALHAGTDAIPGVALAPKHVPADAEVREGTPPVLDADAEPPVEQDPSETVAERKERGFVKEPGSPLEEEAVSFTWYEPAGSIAGMIVQDLPGGALTFIAHLGFWSHASLVLIFLNLLPYSKHFHVITGIPNVYLQSLDPPGRLPHMEDIDGMLEREETLGVKRIDQFSWKAILDFYTCTECGRCSDFCPATNTGKKLSPKHFTLDLRDFLYKHDRELVAAKAAANGNGEAADAASEPPDYHKDLVDGVIDPEVLWACTSCRACEQECPVFITYVDKIVDMRRYLVQERGEFPKELQTAFRSLESAMNPYGFPAEDRAKWAEGLEVKSLSDHPEAEVLFWVGCAPSFDDRAKRVTVATAKLMQRAGVDFAILGQEEQCTGDPARRAGNEYLFQMFAQANVEVMNGYGADAKTIVTTCPHCFNTLLNEYPDFGGRYTVVHHTTFLAKLIREGKLKPTNAVSRKVAWHDSCYLGRYNEVYDDPRDALSSIPGLTVLEPAETRDRGMCCGAGGAQMFKEEEPGEERVNERRADQLLNTSPDCVSSACPFCARMLTDGLAGRDREDVEQLDVAELLLESIVAEEGT